MACLDFCCTLQPLFSKSIIVYRSPLSQAECRIALTQKNRIDILSLCIHETTKDMDSMDAIKTVWRFECWFSKRDVPFYSGSDASTPIGLTSRNCTPQRANGWWSSGVSTNIWVRDRPTVYDAALWGGIGC